MKVFTLMIAAFLLFCISSCQKCSSNPDFGVYFYGFSNTDLSTVVKKSYSKNTNYSVLTSVTIYGDTITTTRTINDTTFVPFPYDQYGNYISISADEDCSFELANNFQKYNISNINFQPEAIQPLVSDYACDNKATYYVNGVRKSYGGYFGKHGSQQSVIIQINK